MRTLLVTIALLFCAIFGSRPAAAVQASEPASDLVRVRVGLMSLEAPRGSQRMLDALARRADHIIPEVERELGVRPASRFRMLLIPPGRITDPEMLALDEAVTPWAAGFMFPERRVGGIRVADAAQYPYGTLEAVLAHEVTHQLLHDAAGDSLPLWFNEGVATWEGRRWDLQDLMVYTRSLLTSGLPALEDLESHFHGSAPEASLAYAASFSFVSWNVSKYGPNLMRDVIRQAKTDGFAAAWEATTGEPLAKAESSWRMRSLIQYRWVPVLAGSGTLWIGITLLFMVAGVRKQQKVKKIKERWAEEEREDAEAERQATISWSENTTQTFGAVPFDQVEDEDESERPPTE